MDHKILVKVAFLKVSVNDDYFMTKVWGKAIFYLEF